MRNIDDDVRKRLEKFLGGPLQPGNEEAKRNYPQRKNVQRRTTIPSLSPTLAPSLNADNTRPFLFAPVQQPGAARRLSLEQAVHGGYTVRVAERGSAYKVITPIPAGDYGRLLQTELADVFRELNSPLQQRMLARCRLNAALEDVLFFDMETTGLTQTPLFLIGAMTWEEGSLVIRQFLARDYGEEAAVIQLFLELAMEKRLFISFNGVSFDLPFLYHRAETHDIPAVLHAHHFDLLHESRRVWRTQCPNCQLQTLEQHICGHPARTADIESELIPAAYQAFVRNGNAEQLAQIMHHNKLDLVSMAELLTRLPALESE